MSLTSEIPPLSFCAEPFGGVVESVLVQNEHFGISQYICLEDDYLDDHGYLNSHFTVGKENANDSSFRI
jgi:hypothetical protein|tara:strand:+ start:371 stop:577 length:207 start_codon:yes stop_codon:yes gene_type:complete